jgi:hypothetical protein
MYSRRPLAGLHRPWFTGKPIRGGCTLPAPLVRICDKPKLRWAVIGALVLAVCAGCSTNQIHSNVEYKDIALSASALRTHGLGFITPSTVTGQEQDVQSLAFLFANVLKQERPDVEVRTLPEVLTAINQADLADEYKRMYVDYNDTGIFKKNSLRKVAEATGLRYLAQLKLSRFDRNSSSRFRIFGLRIIETKEANSRLFVQIWNTESGAIVWEGTEELNYAWDTIQEKPVTFRLVVEQIARNLIDKLPGTPHPTSGS